ncbi:MAG: glycosyltransferase [Candidatus Sericytochromatia bacterium]
MSALFAFLTALNTANLVYLFLLNTTYLLISLLSFRALRKYSRRLKSFSVDQLLGTIGEAPPITVVVPCYNEEETCVESIRSLLNLHYPDFEVMVVNDGSKDETLERLIEAYELEPTPRMPLSDLPTAQVKGLYKSQSMANLWVIDKDNGGKADALNCGINFCQSPLFSAIDADSLLEPDALVRVVRPFLENANTVASGGIVRIANGCEVENGMVRKVRLPKSLVARFQVLEYLRAFLAGRMGWSELGGTFVISGAFGLFRRATVVQMGGYDTSTVGEDMELIVRLHRYCLEAKQPYEIAYVPDPVAWTQCPEDLKTLGNQRDRWQRGLMEALFKHRRMFFNPRYGKAGMLAYPYYFLLEMIGPVIELAGYVSVLITLMMGMLSPAFMIAFFLVAFIYGGIISIFALALEELTFRRYQNLSDLLRLIATALLESFGFRQLLSWWRFRGMMRRLLMGKTGWGQMTRTGFRQPGGTPSAKSPAGASAAH